MNSSTISAKVLMAHFYDLNDSDIRCNYPVYQFENGLILVPCETTHDYFFDCVDNIEGAGLDALDYVENTEDTISFSKKDLSQIWGKSVYEWGDDSSCKKLVKELLFGKK